MASKHMKKRSLNTIYSPKSYNRNNFSKYSPRARMVRLIAFLVILFLAFIFALAVWIVPKITVRKTEEVIVEVLPTPEPTVDPYRKLFMPNDISFIDDLPSWVKTDCYGKPVVLQKEATENGEVIMEMVDKENIIVKGKTQDYYLVLYNKSYGFIKKEHVFQGPVSRTPEIINEILIDDLLSGIKKSSHLVNVEEVVPGVIVDMTLAKADNEYLGTKMYPLQLCLLQSDTAIKLKKAQALFTKDGYTMVVWDAYRPYSVTVEMYENFGSLSKLIPGTLKGSKNNRGAAVDITIVKNDGTPVIMPSETMTMDEEMAARRSKSMSDEVKANVDYLASIMRQAGFEHSVSEWWHFNDMKWKSYPVMDYDLFDF